MDAELFELAVEAAVTVERERGIGTLSEGVLHSAVKYYYQPDPGLHEVNVDGFICDAITENYRLGRTIIEVQTAAFRNLKRKLQKFLCDDVASTSTERDQSEVGSESGAENIARSLTPLSELSGLHKAEFPGKITVVYPLESEKQLVWIDPDTGEAKLGGRSNKGFIPASCLWELYNLADFVGKDGFVFVILGMSMREERLLCGWSKDRKRGSRRVGRVPVRLTHELVFEKREDLAGLIPEGLGDSFDSKSFCKAARMTGATGGAALRCLMRLGVLERTKVGRSYLYSRLV